ncbi:MAG: hypothetical protein U5O39_01735 [Gammaproteobacteria bacterium]|nr:hypothetical protein [Gammaproteobacteria bacterium]
MPDGAIQPRLERAGDQVHLLYFQRESAGFAQWSSLLCALRAGAPRFHGTGRE